MSEEVTATEVGNLSFKEGLDELATIVRSLESNQIELEQSIESYERGVALLASLQKRLSCSGTLSHSQQMRQRP